MSKLDIVVYDAVMGSGKTKKIKESLVFENRPIIYITPLLEEAAEVVGAIIDSNGNHVRDDSGYHMYNPNNILMSKCFMLPSNRNNNGSKIDSVKSLIQNSRNISSTHQLFSMFDQEIIDMIKERDYVLVVDEALNVWSNLNIYDFYDGDNTDKKQSESEKQEQEGTGNTKTDKEILNLIENGVIEVDPVGLLHWQDDKYKVAKGLFFDKVKRLCDLKQLYLSNGRVVFWELNSVVLRAFSKIVVGTYMFEYSFMSYYLDVHGFSYKIEKFGEKPSFYKQYMNIQEGKINEVGDKDYSLSYSHLCVKRHNDKEHPKEILRKNVDNFLKNKCGSKRGDRIWTCFKKIKPTVANRTYTQDWVAYNIKATNKYRDVRCVAYLCNNFPNTYLVSMVSKRNKRKFDADMWALSEMLQYIFRTRVRGSLSENHDRSIEVYIPSKRMRELLKWWLEQDTLDFKSCSKLDK